jgi:hypothetical protein
VICSTRGTPRSISRKDYARSGAQLHPGGVFALWSDDPPDDEFMHVLETAFGNARAHVVTFDNPLLDEKSASTVYVACKTAEPPPGRVAFACRPIAILSARGKAPRHQHQR